MGGVFFLGILSLSSTELVVSCEYTVFYCKHYRIITETPYRPHASVFREPRNTTYGM